MSAGADELVADYLRRLDRELAGLPRAGRREVLDEIREHISEARAHGAESEADVRTLLDRLGDPADIGADARDRFGVANRRVGLIEVAALVLLLVGGLIVPVLGWFVGVVLLWVSDAWSNRDKLIGTFVLPGGLLIAVGLVLIGQSAQTCSNDVGTNRVVCSGGASSIGIVEWGVIAFVALLAPLATTIYLARRMRRASVAT